MDDFAPYYETGSAEARIDFYARRSVGEVVTDAVAFVRQEGRAFWVAVARPMLPYAVVGSMLTAAGYADIALGVWTELLANLALMMAGLLLAGGTYGYIEHYVNEKESPTEADVAVAARANFGPLFGIGLAVGVGGGIIGFVLVLFVLAMQDSVVGLATVVMVGVAVLLALMPVASLWPAARCLDEARGNHAARMWDLTRPGRRWHAAIGLALIVLFYQVIMGAGPVFLGEGLLWSGQTFAGGPDWLGGAVGLVVGVATVAGTVLAALGSVLLAMFYYTLMEHSEGIRLQGRVRDLERDLGPAEALELSPRPRRGFDGPDDAQKPSERPAR
ncbi:MAG: hypothetical protein AAGF99_02825 [Bacteroidota bacterium]